MRNYSKVAKWGNSLAVRIPLAIAKQAGLTEGDSVDLAFDREGGIVLRPARRRYELSDLVAQITSKNRHRETNWGGPQGKESKCEQDWRPYSGVERQSRDRA
jgi:antitoxin MazE